jgi:hypothetical protein
VSLWDNIYELCVITVAMEMLLRDFGLYVFCLYVGWLVIICCQEILGPIGIIFMTYVLL